MVDETKFFAWLDGELPPEEAARVEAKVAADPELSRLADEHRTMTTWLKQSFDTVAEAPLPESLQRAVAPVGAEVIDLAARRKPQIPLFFRPATQWAAMAATLVVGVLCGVLVSPDSTSSPVDIRGGNLYAAGAVDQALDRQLASAGSGGAVRVGLTFRDEAGSVCRTFETAAASGLACRGDDGWGVRGMFAAPEGSNSEYRMAAGADPRLMELVDSTIAGEPFDAAAEAEARRRGWR